jgi:hypothetical protein
VNKRMIAVGAALVLGLGAGAAAAADSVNLSNGASQGNQQMVWLNQTPVQNQPVAGAAANASAYSVNGAGGDSAGAIGSGNGAIFSFTSGGLAGASAANLNGTTADIGQVNLQGVQQDNRAIVLKLSLKNLAVLNLP